MSSRILTQGYLFIIGSEIVKMVIMDTMDFEAHADQARRLDEQDALAKYREEFFIPPGVIYLEGNSLGLLSKGAEEAVHRVLEEWRALGISGWLDAAPGWFNLADEIAGLLAPLVGAEADEIGVGDSTTINLHKLLAALYDPEAERPKLLADELNFPSDLYALKSHLNLRGRDPERDFVVVRSRDGHMLVEDDIVRGMTPDVQMLVISAVLYQSGQLLDLAWLAQEARTRGILFVVDCSHSLGVVPHQLDAWGVDGAFWSNYKNVSGGPGAVSAWYLPRRHFERTPGLAGWFGTQKERQFDMAAEFHPSPDARRLQVGTPPVLSMAPLTSTLRLVADAGIERLRAKSLSQTAFLIKFADEHLGQFGFSVISPRADPQRGGHVALAHAEALRISKALRDAGVVVDFRPPNLIRLGPAPLYTTFMECCDAMRTLAKIMTTGNYRRYDQQRPLVS